MTVFRSANGDELEVATWPFQPARSEAEIKDVVISNLIFTRDRNKLVVEASGGTVCLDEPSMRAIGRMMLRLADDIGHERMWGMAKQEGSP